MSGDSVSADLRTPLGTLRITATEKGIIGIAFTDTWGEASTNGSANAAVADSISRITLAPKLRQLTPVDSLAELADSSGTANFGSAKVHLETTGKQSHLEQAMLQLQQYFSGERHTFALTLAPAGSTFQRQVWQALTAIPFAHSCSYAAIAKSLQNPKAVRAVGAANGRNPIAIVVPCHRVIGANGSLTGYAGGLDRKLWLLQHELQFNSLVNSAATPDRI